MTPSALLSRILRPLDTPPRISVRIVRSVVLCLPIVVSACSSPTGIKLIDPTASVGTLEAVFVATGRTPNEAVAADYSGERSKDLHFASYLVSIPKAHQIGQIEWPERQPDPDKHFAVAGFSPIADEASMRKALNAAFRDMPSRTSGGKKEATLFVHGYNTDFSEALYRTAQMKHDFALDQPTILFSWPSAGSPGLYMYDRDSVKASRDHLTEVIETLVRSDVEQVTLIAHSLGSELLMESLRQIALTRNGRLPLKINALILISPDLDVDVFNSQLSSIRNLPPQFAIFVSSKDQALQISSFLAGDQHRVGNLIDQTKILREGIAVVDVSEFDGGDSLNHMTAATSPSLISILKGVSTSGRGLMVQAGEQQTFSQAVTGTAVLPLTLVIRTTEAIFQPQ